MSPIIGAGLLQCTTDSTGRKRDLELDALDPLRAGGDGAKWPITMHRIGGLQIYTTLCDTAVHDTIQFTRLPNKIIIWRLKRNKKISVVLRGPTLAYVVPHGMPTVRQKFPERGLDLTSHFLPGAVVKELYKLQSTGPKWARSVASSPI